MIGVVSATAFALLLSQPSPLEKSIQPKMCRAEVFPKPGEPTTLMIQALVEFRHKVRDEIVELRRVQQAPPKVLLLVAETRPKRGRGWDFHQSRIYEVLPYRPDLQGELTVVRVCDVFGRVLVEFPIKSPKPRK